MLRQRYVVALTVAGLVAAVAAASPASPGRAATRSTGTALQRALDRLVAMPSGPPGVIVIVQHGGSRTVYRAGTASLPHPRPPTIADHDRLASVSKAFSGAVTLHEVSRRRLRLADTIGHILPALPRRWHRVSLRELLQHRSGLPDFTTSPGFVRHLRRTPRRSVLPMRLLRWVWHAPLQFRPGTRYKYDNTDNVVAAMMARSVTHRRYRPLLHTLVYQPAGLHQTRLPAGPRMPRPFLHGYSLRPGQPPEDDSEVLAAGLAWASGGIVSTPADANAFIRAYLGLRFFSRRTQQAQLRFVPGSSEPPGPGTNAAGLAIFRYRTRCGTVYGHTGNIFGYTQFAAASKDGTDSVTATATEQLAPGLHSHVFAALRHAELLAVCAATAARPHVLVTHWQITAGRAMIRRAIWSP